ncbi:hypothetical protein [uncultured Bacteroides sp.]|uniref:hypothetical protein n=1 Tax=uncultured Bacteroides sp. TaxID=162156 RepID=UPI00262F0953|nr:hypothetical protein [uncultured Bacteroides sp.]
MLALSIVMANVEKNNEITALFTDEKLISWWKQGGGVVSLLVSKKREVIRACVRERRREFSYIFS